MKRLILITLRRIALECCLWSFVAAGFLAVLFAWAGLVSPADLARQSALFGITAGGFVSAVMLRARGYPSFAANLRLPLVPLIVGVHLLQLIIATVCFVIL